ncbi:MAG: hypothetical protein N2Z65_05990 [Clostridiales bacterium]|nr:hypothetical protein [Clostridiales bacterium]
MSIYEKINDILIYEDLIQCGHKLIGFADAARGENNRAAIVKHFYESLTENALSNYEIDPDHARYQIFSGREAVVLFLLLNLPGMESPVKTLDNIKALGERIISEFVLPVGKRIGQTQIEEIINYLDKKFNFSQKVFSGHKAMFLMMDYSNLIRNGECIMLQDKDNKLSHHICLYNLKTNDEKSPEPAAVFFHELGRALHGSYAGTIEFVPPGLLKLLKELCFPNIYTIPPAEQCKILADVLSVGLMYESPYSVYDPFEYMHNDDKQVFSEIAKMMIDVCNQRNK